MAELFCDGAVAVTLVFGVGSLLGSVVELAPYERAGSKLCIFL
jgi:hypothetical protein